MSKVRTYEKLRICGVLREQLWCLEDAAKRCPRLEIPQPLLRGFLF